MSDKYIEQYEKETEKSWQDSAKLAGGIFGVTFPSPDYVKWLESKLEAAEQALDTPDDEKECCGCKGYPICPDATTWHIKNDSVCKRFVSIHQPAEGKE